MGFKFNPFVGNFDAVSDPAGSDTQIQFNDGGAFGADSAFVFNKTTDVLSVPTLGGGSASGGNLTLQSTSHATKGKILFGTSAYDEVNNRLGIEMSSGMVTPLEIPGSTTNSSAKFGSYELQSYAVNNSWLGENIYYDSNYASFRYRANGKGILQYMSSDGFEVRTVATGIANTNATTIDRLALGMTGDFAIGGSITSLTDYTGCTMCGVGGNVGIGTTSPATKLEVAGDVSIIGTGGVGYGKSFYLYNDDGTKVFRQYMQTGGNLIQNAPAWGVSSTATTIVINAATYIDLVSGTGQNMYLDCGGNFIFRDRDDSNATRMVIQSSNGNVGIGTTSPSSSLDVNGVIEVADGTYIAPSLTFGAEVATGFYRSGGGTIGIAAAGGLTKTGGNLYLLYNPSISGTTAKFGTSVLVYNSQTAGTYHNMECIPTYAQASGTCSNTDLFINRNESAGIGSGAQYLIDAQVNSVSKFAVTNTGNVGIGTASPAYNLEISNTGDAILHLKADSGNSGTGQIAGTRWSVDGGSTYFDLTHTNEESGSTDNQNLLWSFNGGEIMRYNRRGKFTQTASLAGSTGNEYAYVLNYTTNKATSGDDTGLVINQIDTLSPGNSYLIRGSVSDSYKFLVTNAGGGYFAGNVGIGTSSPSQKLDVNGTTLFRNGDSQAGGNQVVQHIFGYNNSSQYPHFITTRHSSGTNGSICFYTGDGTVDGVYPTNAIIGLSIENGKVGIGKVSPQYNLDIVGTIHATLGLSFGTVTPLAFLHLLGGDSQATYTNPTIALGYSTAGSYPHFIHTRHTTTANSEAAIDIYTHSDGTFANAIHGMTIANGRVGIGGVTAPVAKAHIDQSSTTGAIPVLTVDQADVSEEFIRFIGSCTDGDLTGSIVEAADVSTATIAGYLKVYVQDDADVLTDQAYFVPLYTLS